MNASQAATLREAFPVAMVGKLPRTTCKDCSQSPSKACSKHPKKRCSECGNNMTPQHIHLDYVGHAAVTDRLLQADPLWTWEPLGVDQYGAPLVSTNGKEVSMWINLTVCGVTRPGVGIVAANTFEREKQLISDALRNAAMRFGVALDLWSKQDLDIPDDTAGTNDPPLPANVAKSELLAACNGDKDLAVEMWGDRGSQSISREDLDDLVSHTPVVGNPQETK